MPVDIPSQESFKCLVVVANQQESEPFRIKAMAVVGFVIRPPVFKTPEGDLPAFSYIFVRERIGPGDR